MPDVFLRNTYISGSWEVHKVISAPTIQFCCSVRPTPLTHIYNQQSDLCWGCYMPNRDLFHNVWPCDILEMDCGEKSRKYISLNTNLVLLGQSRDTVWGEYFELVIRGVLERCFCFAQFHPSAIWNTICLALRSLKIAFILGDFSHFHYSHLLCNWKRPEQAFIIRFRAQS